MATYGSRLARHAKRGHQASFVDKQPRVLPARPSILTSLTCVFLAFHAPCLCAFALRKQDPLHLQREKQGLSLHEPAGNLNWAVDRPGVSIVSFEPTGEEKKLASLLKTLGTGRPGQWKKVKKILSNYSGYSPLVLGSGMRAALRSQEYQEGAKLFERLQQANAPTTLPVYTIAMKLYGKLHRQDEVRQLWEELVGLDLVNKINAQARIDACADNGNFKVAAEVLDYLDEKGIEVDELHYSSAINACANSNEEKRANAAKYLLEEMLRKELKPNIVTYSCILRTLRQSPGQDLVDLLDSMKAQGVMANNVFAENFFYIFLKQPRKGCWTNKAAVVADLQKLPPGHLETAKRVMDEFLAAGIDLNASCRRIKAALEALLWAKIRKSWRQRWQVPGRNLYTCLAFGRGWKNPASVNYQQAGAFTESCLKDLKCFALGLF